MNKSPKFNFGDTVYHVCDTSQNPLLIVGVVHRGNYFTYIAAGFDSEKEYNEIELQTEKTVF